MTRSNSTFIAQPNSRMAEPLNSLSLDTSFLKFTGYRFPGEIAPGLKFADIPNGVAAIDTIPALGWAQMIFLIGAVDYYGFLGDFPAGKPDLGPEKLAERQLHRSFSMDALPCLPSWSFSVMTPRTLFLLDSTVWMP